jgi:hypothetical protein
MKRGLNVLLQPDSPPLDPLTIREIVRVYQSFVLDIVVERAAVFLDDPEIAELIHELADLLGVSEHHAAQLLYPPYRLAICALRKVHI